MKRSFVALLLLVVFAVGTAYGAEEFKPQIRTSLRVQSMFQNDETCTQASTFDIKRVRIGLAAIMDEHLSARAAIEGRDKDDGIIVMEAYGVYELNKYLRFQAGQMYAPFGLESRRGFDKREFYDRTFVTDLITRDMGRRPTGKRDGRYRDIGVEAIGTATYEGYRFYGDVMLMNGNGILTTDNNDAKDFVARGTVTAPFGLSVGGSFYQGTYVVARDSAGQDEWAYGLELAWVGKIGTHDTRIEAEYIQGKWDARTGTTEPRGAYLAAASYIVPRLQGAARFEWFEPDQNNSPVVDWKRTSLALRYFLVKGSFVAVDYEFRDKDNEDLGNRLTLQLMTVF